MTDLVATVREALNDDVDVREIIVVVDTEKEHQRVPPDVIEALNPDGIESGENGLALVYNGGDA